MSSLSQKTLEWAQKSALMRKKKTREVGAHILYITSAIVPALIQDSVVLLSYIIPKAGVAVLYCALSRYAIHSSPYHWLAGPSLGNYLLFRRFTITWAAIPFLQRLLNENHLDEYLAKTGAQQQWAGAQNHKQVPRK